MDTWEWRRGMPRFFSSPKYLMYAKAAYPRVYEGIVGNPAFCRAFTRIDANATRFITAYFYSKNELLSRLESDGYTIEEDESFLYIGKGDSLRGNGHFLDVYNLPARELSKPKYTALVKYIAGGVSRPFYPVAHIKGVSGLYESTGTMEEESYYASYNEGVSVHDTPLRVDVSREEESREVEVRSAGPDTTAAASGATLSGELIARIRETRFVPENPGEEQEFVDRVGDVNHSFADITTAKVKRYGNAMEFAITIASLPDRLIFNNPKIECNYLEYSWDVDLDMDGDGIFDYSISADSFKFDDDPPIESTILKYVDRNVWKLTDDGGDWVDIPLVLDKRGNTLVFTLPENDVLPISDFTAATRFLFKTYYNQGDMVYDDSR